MIHQNSEASRFLDDSGYIPHNAPIELADQIVELLSAGLRKMSLNPHAFGRRSNVFDPFLMDAVDAFGWPSSFMSGRSGSGTSSEMAPFVHARIDWKESSNAHVFQADVPGLMKEEVKVEVEDGRVLAISGEKRKEMEKKGDMWHRVERSSGRFSRKFRLPENAKVEEVKASIENGVLTVTVPKNLVEKKANIKSIQISGQPITCSSLTGK